MLATQPANPSCDAYRHLERWFHVFLTDCKHFRRVVSHIQPMLDRRTMLTLRKHLCTLGIIGAPAVPADLAFTHQDFQHIPHLSRLLWVIIILMKLVEINIVGF